MSDRIVIVGPGRMGLAIGATLIESGELERLTFFGRDVEPPPHPLFESARKRAEYRIWPGALPERTNIVILAVPDGRLAEVAQTLAAAGPPPPGCVALHLAGALSTDVLSPLHAAGYAVGSMHPLQTVADPWSGGDRLRGSAFAIAGEPEALATAKRLVRRLEGLPLVIPPAFRPVYHAAGVFASNYLVALVSATVRLLGQAGIPEHEAVDAVLPLIRGTLNNLENLGVAAALTGPIARGDVDTVRLHLARLSPDDRSLYCALGQEALRLAVAAGLDDARAAELHALLSMN